jgi:hypothetical protein
MPAAKDKKRVAARRTVRTFLRWYLDTMLGRFPAPEKLIERVEEKLTPRAQAEQANKT